MWNLAIIGLTAAQAQEAPPAVAPAVDPQVEALRAELLAMEGARKASAEEIARLRAAWEAASLLFDDRQPQAERVAAARRLVETADGKAVPLLQSAVLDRDPRVARGALGALALLPGRPGAVELAARVARDPRLEDSVRQAAIEALGTMGDRAAGEALWALAGDAESLPIDLRRQAVSTLERSFAPLVAERGGLPSTGADRLGSAAVVVGTGVASGAMLSAVGSWGQGEAGPTIGAIGGTVVGLGSGAFFALSKPIEAGQGLRYASNVGLGLTAAGLLTQATFGHSSTAPYVTGRQDDRRDVGALYRVLGVGLGAGSGYVAARYRPSVSDVAESDLSAYLLGQVGVGVADLVHSRDPGFSSYCYPYDETGVELTFGEACKSVDRWARGRAGAGLAGGAVGIGLAGWSREAWDISRDDLLVAGLGGMEGLWTGLLLPEVLDGRAQLGAQRVGIHAGAALGLGLSQVAPMEASTTALALWGSALGKGAGAAVPLLVQADGAVTAGTTLGVGLLGAAAGAVAGPELVFDEGDRSMIGVGTALALGEGLALGGILRQYDVIEGGPQVPGLMLGLGSAVGVGLTAGAASWSPAREDMIFLGTAAGWGAWYGSLVPVALGQSGRAVLLAGTLTADAFLLGGAAALRPSVGLDPRRTALPQLVGVGGATIGALGVALASPKGDAVAMGAVVGSTVGLIGGAVVEAQRPPPKAPTPKKRQAGIDLPGRWSGALAPTLLENGDEGLYGELRVTGW
jgi:hypothetical protein